MNVEHVRVVVTGLATHYPVLGAFSGLLIWLLTTLQTPTVETAIRQLIATDRASVTSAPDGTTTTVTTNTVKETEVTP